MKGISFPRVLGKYEFRIGLAYFLFHIFAMPFVLSFCVGLMNRLNIPVTEVIINAVYQLIGLAMLLIILRKYLIENFGRFLNWLPMNLLLIVCGVIAYYVLYLAFAMALQAINGGMISNPNNEAVAAMTLESLYPTMAVAVLLAPIVEECLFRGVLFCGIGAKSRLLGYGVSTALFALFHVYQAMLLAFSPELFLTFLLYVPSGLVLGWVYEKSGTIWCSVFVHMAVNLASLLLTYYVVA